MKWRSKEDGKRLQDSRFGLTRGGKERSNEDKTQGHYVTYGNFNETQISRFNESRLNNRKSSLKF